jgi:erythromycin esterase-like protein
MLGLAEIKPGDEVLEIGVGSGYAAVATFQGLDIYSLAASIEVVLAYLDKVDPDAARVARQRYGCLVP